MEALLVTFSLFNLELVLERFFAIVLGTLNAIRELRILFDWKDDQKMSSLVESIAFCLFDQLSQMNYKVFFILKEPARHKFTSSDTVNGSQL